MQERARSPIAALVLLMVVVGCGEEPVPGPVDMDAAELEQWEIALVEWRIEKNEGLMQSAESPLPEERREGFEGLDYYFPEESFRYVLPLETATAGGTVELDLRKGESVTYEVRGKIRFQHGGQDLELTVFAPTGEGEGKLWIPFHDKTNGETTYAGGRYLDPEPQAGGMIEVDFNKAYNPYCAYDAERWNCTLPPAENTLPIRVEAGEKLLSQAKH
jgi:uncharacterized protein (DUF1684 family)